ncbi:PREDICTED: zinc finger protein 706 isoform X1 [Cercocebus atys]|uniref:zinc finger protein 706 isoform X1 n=1 Tax=Cercocebus atys TaxID=9531 RepID=UPI0005F3F9A3|nr:PREDICTED: zinc finger protein 706 isoform X1 [Cercocebus atys]
MARGQQKIQSQQKNAKKQAGQKKKQGHDQKAAAKAALIYTCTVCRVRGIESKDTALLHKCQTLRPSSSTLRASILRLHFLQN